MYERMHTDAFKWVILISLKYLAVNILKNGSIGTVLIVFL